ncbi:unnamed protein product [Caenorhabditis sp. 36 PRJEB53466]|nr:unnamed protein product [Caenorhabditis sp. 36 PRJEB53466]
MPTIYKLYSSLWNRRIRSVKGVMSKCQRGFQEREGCNESIGILRTAIDVAKGRKKNLSVAWLDLTNAFGSVPHELIEHTLKKYGFPEEIVHVIKDMYNGASIRVKSKNEKSNQIKLNSGVKQGDPISPTLFNMCLEGVIRKHLDTSLGHKCLKTKVKILAFADDMAILSDSKKQLQEELARMDDDCTPLKLIFKPSKCASLIIEKGKVRPEAQIMLKGESIRNLSPKGTYKYLGVQTGVETRISELELLTKVTKELEKVNTSDLTPPQKLDCVKAFVLPKLTYMYANSVPKMTELGQFANMTMRAVKVMHSIPVRGSPLEYIQIPTSKGGLGVACPRITAEITFLVSTMKKLWSSDQYIQRLYREYLEEVTRIETGKDQVTLGDMAAYLSNEIPIDIKAFGFSCFTRLREVCNSLWKIKSAPLHKVKIVEFKGDLAISVQAIEKGKERIFTKEHVKKLQQLLKGEVNDALSHRFTTDKVVKSEVVRVIQQYPQCNSFVRKGGKVSQAAHKFVHRARLNLLSCNYNTYDNTKSKECRRCHYENETQWHILQSCTFGLPKKITERHDAVLMKVKKLIEAGSKKDWKLKIDQEIPGFTRLRPDIYMRSPDGKEIIMADVACPYEHGVEAMKRSWDKKVQKYSDGFSNLKAQDKKLTVLPIIVGSLGSWWKPTTDSLKKLGIEDTVIKKVIPELCSTVLEYSKNAYWNHIFGDSYTEIPLKFGDEKPKGNSWKKDRPKHAPTIPGT